MGYIVLSAAYVITTHTGESVTTRALVECIYIGASLYSKTATILFYISCKMISNQLCGILDQFAKSPNVANSFNQICALQHQHAQICYSVDLLNKCFGSFLFFEILFIFVGCINNGMKAIINSNTLDFYIWAHMISDVAHYIVNIFLICLGVESISKQVKSRKLNQFYAMLFIKNLVNI